MFILLHNPQDVPLYHFLLPARLDIDAGYDHEFARELLLWVRRRHLHRRHLFLDRLHFLDGVHGFVVLEFGRCFQARVNLRPTLQLRPAKLSFVVLLRDYFLVGRVHVGWLRNGSFFKV